MVRWLFLYLKCKSLYFLSGDSSVSVEVNKLNLERIKGCFASLISRVSTRLTKMDIDMTEFRVYISTRFPPGDFVLSATTVSDIFTALNKNLLWDFFHFTPIEDVCRTFGRGDKELSELISDYKSELAGYKATTKISGFITECDDSDDDIAESTHFLNIARYDRKYCRRLTVKLKDRVTQKSLDYIDKFWRSIADFFVLPSLPVLLGTIHEG